MYLPRSRDECQCLVERERCVGEEQPINHSNSSIAVVDIAHPLATVFRGDSMAADSNVIVKEMSDRRARRSLQDVSALS